MSESSAGTARSDRLGRTLAERPWILLIGLFLVTAVALRLEGRLWWCNCGLESFWTSDAWGPRTSQALFDPYSFTHLLHGLVLFWVLWMVPAIRRSRWLVVITLAIEALWEVIENSAYVINRYRTATAALGYEGDTVANALGDIVWCWLGIVVARRIGFRWTVALFVVTEAILVVWFRDSLLLNVVMLLYPIDAVARWQMSS